MCNANVIMCFYAALVDADPEENWYDASGNILQPSRWISADEPEEQDSYGRCLGLRCRPWQRCQKAADMVHALFGGSGRDSALGWAALNKDCNCFRRAEFLWRTQGTGLNAGYSGAVPA